MEIIGEMYDKYLEVHVLMKSLKMLNVIVMQKLFFELKSIALSSGAELFAPGESSQCMYFVLDGKLEYKCGKESEILTGGNTAVEVVMWTPWVYHGKLNAMEGESDLLGLTAQAFQMVLTQHPGTI